MIDLLYRHPRARKRFGQCWLREVINEHLVFLKSQGYAENTIKKYGNTLLRLAEYVERQGQCRVAELPQWVDPFVASPCCSRPRSASHSMVNRFLGRLRKEGIIPTPASAQREGPFPRILAEYGDFLCGRRGISVHHANAAVRFSREFLKYVRDSGTQRISAISPGAVMRFVTTEGKHHTRQTMSGYCAFLRGLLSYLHVTGRIRRDLSAVVITPRTYCGERCPRYLAKTEIETLLCSIPRHTNIGKRDYAMMLLMATYGLRGVEAARLRLEDIDWRTSTLPIRTRKAGNNSDYPLSASVGNAILCYLRDGRPQNGHREVFLSSLAPRGPIGSAAVRCVVRRRLVLCGIAPDRAGAHTFRYSCAQRLLEDEFPLKEIADYLGHRRLQTTQGYMKIDIPHLREIAMNDGETLL